MADYCSWAHLTIPQLKIILVFPFFFNSFKHSNMCCGFPSEQYRMRYFPSSSLINEQFFALVISGIPRVLEIPLRKYYFHLLIFTSLGTESLALMSLRWRGFHGILLEKDTWQPGDKDTKGARLGQQRANPGSSVTRTLVGVWVRSSIKRERAHEGHGQTALQFLPLSRFF